jgi:protein-S-isoprenylcysteine O-methyltransferase Ste14
MALIEEMQKQGNFLFRNRSFLPVPLLIIGIAFHLYVHLFAETDLPDNYFYFICFGVSFIGLIIRSITIGYTPKNTSGRNTKQQVADNVNTTGIYSIVRHPLYLGNFFMWLGLAMVTYSFWFTLTFVLVYWVYYERIMFAEEAFLRGKFGDNYINWAAGIPAFIPNFRLWEPAPVFFSFKNVLKRETTGLFLMVTLFFVFEYSHEIFMNGFNYFELSSIGYFWFGFFLFMIVFYLFIRTLRKNTKILNVEGR